MRETVSRNSSIDCYEIPQESLWQALRWIHFDISESEFDLLIADVLPRLNAAQSMLPLELVLGTSRIAAAYFVNVGGSVATLGGMRAKHGFEQQAGSLLQKFHSQLQTAGIAQIQALVDVNNFRTQIALLNSTFRQVTKVRHLWFDLQTGCCNSTTEQLTKSDQADGGLLLEYSLQPAYHFSREQIAALVEETFRGSLDCPELDGVRSGAELVAGFLEAQSWNEQLPWWILCKNERPIGCALLNQHTQAIFELAYLGLIESERGCGLGRYLVRQAIEVGRQRGGQFLTTAVDTKNWPACEIYNSLDFAAIRELGVWLPSNAKSKQIAA